MSEEELNRAVELFVRQVGHWSAPRWAAPATGGDASRADVVHRLVQQIADLTADVESQPRRRVPRLDNDLALPDQLRVVAADLLAADAPEQVVTTATEQVAADRWLL